MQITTPPVAVPFQKFKGRPLLSGKPHKLLQEVLRVFGWAPEGGNVGDAEDHARRWDQGAQGEPGGASNPPPPPVLDSLESNALSQKLLQYN